MVAGYKFLVTSFWSFYLCGTLRFSVALCGTILYALCLLPIFSKKNSLFSNHRKNPASLVQQTNSNGQLEKLYFT
ncbi:MAG: hypothetical protein DWQ02_00405 [Bacteroidetes bacterium]|nr:MAG: hypothetical protein DWQ02_00405 [Bacteroidota bacterium]